MPRRSSGVLSHADVNAQCNTTAMRAATLTKAWPTLHVCIPVPHLAMHVTLPLVCKAVGLDINFVPFVLLFGPLQCYATFF